MTFSQEEEEVGGGMTVCRGGCQSQTPPFKVVFQHLQARNRWVFFNEMPKRDLFPPQT